MKALRKHRQEMYRKACTFSLFSNKIAVRTFIANAPETQLFRIFLNVYFQSADSLIPVGIRNMPTGISWYNIYCYIHILNCYYYISWYNKYTNWYKSLS